ncbi:MAG: hypothetical protein IAF38_06465, partial [Bacteroidia bacterium]|nr:hypothetical protein [Bacteroidia bacterium]
LSEVLCTSIIPLIPSVNDEILDQLCKHSFPPVHAIAGRILLYGNIPAEKIPDLILLTLLQSESVVARNVAVELIGKLPEAVLVLKKNLLLSLAISPLADMRKAVHPVLDKLVKYEKGLGKEIVELFLPMLTIKEKYEGLHQDILELIRGKLSEHLDGLDRKKIFSLCKGKYIAAQELGFYLLTNKVDMNSLDTDELVSLAGAPLLAMRQHAWNYIKVSVPRMKAEKKEAVRLTDSEWADTRQFAFDFFRDNFSSEDWEPGMFVSLCDSVKEDVQAYGREMITRWFEKDKGFEYLVKLSQHPDGKMQLFASGFLDNYAKNNFSAIEKLHHYFITLLSQVNKGRVAKTRAIHLLTQEALADEKTAHLVATIFNRISATAAIQDKAQYIKSLRDIHKKYPSVEVMIKINEVKAYGELKNETADVVQL